MGISWNNEPLIDLLHVCFLLAGGNISKLEMGRIMRLMRLSSISLLRLQENCFNENPGWEKIAEIERWLPVSVNT